MELIRVNLSLEKEVWCAFDALAPKRSKSQITLAQNGYVRRVK